MNYTIIRNDEQYEEYLEHLSEIFDMDFSEHPEYKDDFDLLVLLINDYEEKNYPINKPSPVDYIKFIMEQKGLTNKDMREYLGGPSKVSEILNGKRRLSLNMIKKLHNGLGMDTDILIQDVNDIDEEPAFIESKLARNYNNYMSTKESTNKYSIQPFQVSIDTCKNNAKYFPPEITKH